MKFSENHETLVEGLTSVITVVQFSRTGRYLAYGDVLGYVHILDRRGNSKPSLSVRLTNEITQIRWNPKKSKGRWLSWEPPYESLAVGDLSGRMALVTPLLPNFWSSFRIINP